MFKLHTRQVKVEKLRSRKGKDMSWHAALLASLSSAGIPTPTTFITADALSRHDEHGFDS